MAHLGIISPPVHSHLRLFIALGRELMARGHQITFFQMPDVGDQVRAEGFGFVPIGESDHPPGSLPAFVASLGLLTGLPALRFIVAAIQRGTEMICRDAPRAIAEANVDLLLVDQTEPAGGTVAEHLRLPFITVCAALALNREPDLPPPFTPWSYWIGWPYRLRNSVGYRLSDLILRPVLRTLARHRVRMGLPVHRDANDCFSTLAQISQQPPAFDFPRFNLPATFHYVGPLRATPKQAVIFPWEKLDGRPLIYASMGSLVNRDAGVYACFAAACRDLDVQLVITTAGGLRPEVVRPRAPGALVVAEAPQTEVIARASLTITHGGLNTVLDSLTCGVPMIAVPSTTEQPAIGARILWTACGQVIPRKRLNAARLRKAVNEVLGDPAYAAAARRQQDSIRHAGGVTRAADIVEDVLRAQQPLRHPLRQPGPLTMASGPKSRPFAAR